MGQLRSTLANVELEMRSLPNKWQDASRKMVEELQNSLNTKRENVSIFNIFQFQGVPTSALDTLLTQFI